MTLFGNRLAAAWHILLSVCIDAPNRFSAPQPPLLSETEKTWHDHKTLGSLGNRPRRRRRLYRNRSPHWRSPTGRGGDRWCRCRNCSVGAVAYAVSQADDDEDDDKDSNYRHRDHREHSRHSISRDEPAFYHPRRGVTCYTYAHRCYLDGRKYSANWTRREF